MFANQVVRGTSPDGDLAEGARQLCLIPRWLMDATAEYPAWESLGVVPVMFYRDFGILREYRGFTTISLR